MEILSKLPLFELDSKVALTRILMFNEKGDINMKDPKTILLLNIYIFQFDLINANKCRKLQNMFSGC